MTVSRWTILKNLNLVKRIGFAVALLFAQPVASFSGSLPSKLFGRSRLTKFNLGLSGKDRMHDFHTVSIPTLEHYSSRAEQFWQGTKDHDVTQNREALLRNLYVSFPGAGEDQRFSFDILDLGCGPGRDIKAFLEMGHRVTGQPALATRNKPRCHLP